MNISKNSEGAWVISDVVNGYLMTRRYYGYTLVESIRLFNSESR